MKRIASLRWLLSTSIFVACGGNAFTSAPASNEASGGGGSGRPALGNAGLSGQSGAASSPQGGSVGGSSSPSPAGSAGSAGSADTAGSVGSPDLAGAGGESDEPRSCVALSGAELGGHCYVDISAASATQTQASEACSKFATQAHRPSHLLVLDSQAEQGFILVQFLKGLADVSDAWLGLTCSDVLLPDFASCYCTNCTSAALLAKRKMWRWMDSSTATFGWIGENPNGGGRCAALGYNPTISSWGWVDRACDKDTFKLGAAFPTHTYRTICELE